MTKKPVYLSHFKLKQTKSPTIKSMTQSLPSRSSQDEFSKSNTAPQSVGKVVPDKNTKEHLKNKVNQKDLTLIKQKYFSHFTQIENLKVSRQKPFHLFPSNTFIQVIYVYTTIKPCQT